MTVSPWLCYLGASALVGGISRIWVLYRRDRKARRAFRAVLFDVAVLDAALVVREREDADIVSELRETLIHLNRQAYADEFWALDGQLSAYYARIPKKSRPTMRRALMSLVASEDRWLSLIAAKTSARIGFSEALPALAERIDRASGCEPKADADRRYVDELQSALEKLRGGHPVA